VFKALAAGWLLQESIGKQEYTGNLLVDRAYEDKAARIRAAAAPKERNGTERFCLRLKKFRGICSGYEKPERVFTDFICLACIGVSFLYRSPSA
jgi:hypothetical protein